MLSPTLFLSNCDGEWTLGEMKPSEINNSQPVSDKTRDQQKAANPEPTQEGRKVSVAEGLP